MATLTSAKAKTRRVLDLVTRLTGGLPQPAARRLRRRILRLVVASHKVDHKPPPEWVRELRRQLQNGNGNGKGRP